MSGQVRKRILHELVVSEISAVDRMAQAGARAVILKRDGGAPEREEPATLVKCAAIFSKALAGHAHIVSLSDGDGALLTGGITGPSGHAQYATHTHPWIVAKDGRIVIGEAEGHRHDVDETEASALLEKIAKGIVASAVLGLPADLPQSLAALGREWEYAPDSATPEQRAAADRRNAQRRDREERERVLNPRGHVRTLADLDQALETRARELARDSETMVAAFTRLVAAKGDDRDAEFTALLAERERVARFGAGYQAAGS